MMPQRRMYWDLLVYLTNNGEHRRFGGMAIHEVFSQRTGRRARHVVPLRLRCSISSEFASDVEQGCEKSGLMDKQ